MQWNIQDAIQTNSLAHLCVDHQTMWLDIRYERYRDYCDNMYGFHETMEMCDHVPSISICYDLDYQKDATHYETWYDDQQCQITNHDAFIQNSYRLGLIYKYITNKNLCLKNTESCFENTHLLDYLTENNKKHFLFTGAYLDDCIKQSIYSIMDLSDISIGIIKDLTYASAHFHQHSIQHKGYENSITGLFGDRVMITDQKSVVEALQVTKPIRQLPS